jgi:hypothetical protein
MSKVTLRFAALAALSFIVPMAWYMVSRAWFDTGSGFLYALFYPDSALVFLWPVAIFVAVGHFVTPKPRSLWVTLIALPVVGFLGLWPGMVIGLLITCSWMNKCL